MTDTRTNIADNVAMKHCVLVVEDDAFIALDLEDVLSEAGFVVNGPVGTVADALALVEKAARGDVPIHVALLDYNLGEETSIPVAHKLEELGIPFLFLSGQVSSVMLGKTKTDPLVLSKPFVPAHLVKTVGGLVVRD